MVAKSSIISVYHLAETGVMRAMNPARARISAQPALPDGASYRELGMSMHGGVMQSTVQQETGRLPMSISATLMPAHCRSVEH